MFCLFSSSQLVAQEQDSIIVLKETKIDLRIPVDTKIKEYQKDKHFNYEQSSRFEYPEWILKVFDWFDRLFGKTLNKVLTREFFIIVSGIFITVLLIAIILRVQNVRLRSLFSRRKLNEDEIHIYSEDVNDMNFESLISTSIKSQNYRLATRFLYLKNLKDLSDKLIISWNPNKTNYSYQYEIANILLKQKFVESTRIFDFVWYGEFILDAKSFEEAHNFFKELNVMINNER